MIVDMPAAHLGSSLAEKEQIKAITTTKPFKGLPLGERRLRALPYAAIPQRSLILIDGEVSPWSTRGRPR